MLTYMKRSFFVAIISMFMATTQAQVKENNENKEIETPEQTQQIAYLKNAMQKEIWNIILTDTFELQKDELKNGIIFKESEKYNVLKYQQWMTDICVAENTSNCPEIFFTRKSNIPIASMYPNGKLLLNIDVLDRLNDDELYFTIAHEMGHFVNQDSFKNTHMMAHLILENGLMIADMEKWVGASFMIPGMREYHHKVEAAADQFALKYMKKNKIKIDCEVMFHKMVGNEKVSTEQHAGTNERCQMIAQK